MVSLRKLNPFYIWIILLVIAILVFILLRSPAAGQRQASQGLTELDISAITADPRSSNQQPLVEEKPTSDSSLTVPTPTPDDGNLKPLPEVTPSPVLYKGPRCPLVSDLFDGGSWHSRCQGRCDIKWPQSEDIACLEL
jgi:hypothetical protein